MSFPGPVFGIVPVGQPVITEPTSTPAPASFLYALTVAKKFSHIVVFLLPTVVLPVNTAAAIYLTTARGVDAAAQSGEPAPFQFLGGIGPGKESAMFKVGSRADAGSSGLVIGISIEPVDSVSQRLQELNTNKTASPAAPSQPTTVVLAQRVIQNAFNFLASFSGSAGPDGVEVVPLKAFEEWWRKFESRVRSDPGFLEKQSA